MTWLHNLKNSAIFCIVLLLLIFLSCDIFDSNTLEKLQIQGNVLFCAGFVEYPDSTTAYHRIKIIIETEKTYPCANYSITTKVSKHYNNITIALLYITVPKICLTAVGPASTEIILNLAEGDYSLNFFHNGVTDYYKLDIRLSGIRIWVRNYHFSIPSLECF